MGKHAKIVHTQAPFRSFQPWYENEKSYTPRSPRDPKLGLADRRDPKPGVYDQKTTNRIHQDPIIAHFGPRQARNLVYMSQKICATSRSSPDFRMFQGLAETQCTKSPCSYTPRPPPIHQECTKKSSYTPKKAHIHQEWPYTPIFPRRDPSVRKPTRNRSKIALHGLRRRWCQSDSNLKKEPKIPGPSTSPKGAPQSPRHPAWS